MKYMRTFALFRVVWDWPPPWTGLGPGPYELTVAQQKIGNTVTVVTGGWPFRKKERIAQASVIRLPSGLIPRVNASVFFTTAPCALVAYILKKLFSKIDIIHTHGHLSLFFSLYKKYFGRFDKTPLVVHLHHISSARYRKIVVEHNGKPPWLVRFEWFLQIATEKLAMKYASRIIVVSESMKEEILQDYTVSADVLYVMVNGVNTEVFSPGGEVANLTVTTSKKILFVGNLNQRKNPDLVIKALRCLSQEYGAVFIGPDYMNGVLQQLVSELGLRERVEFVGTVHNRDLAKYMRACKVLVLPSSSEGFPKVVLEALACGVPVAASGFSAGQFFDEMITYIDTLTAESVADAIRIAEDRTNTISPDRIKKDVSWDARARELNEVYASLVQK